jgi:hypothetical protein
MQPATPTPVDVPPQATTAAVAKSAATALKVKKRGRPFVMAASLHDSARRAR